MAWKDELDNAKKVFRNGTAKEKAEYVFDYYKWHILIIIFILYFLSSILYSNLTAKDYVLQGLLLNTLSQSEAVEEIEQGFLEAYPIDSSKEEIFLDSSIYYSSNSKIADDPTNYQTLQIISVRIAAGEIDFMIADDATLTDFTYDQYFSDLSEVLTPEQMKLYEPYFLYYDKAVLEEINNLDPTLETFSEITIPDPAKPELMKEPIPVMINISSSDKLDEIYPVSSQNYAFAFVVNSTHNGKTIELLEYLME